MRRRGGEKRKNRREGKDYDPYKDKREKEEILPRCRGVRWRRYAPAASVSEGEQRRCCARWRAASPVLWALERKKRAREE